jgi:hypothetical protein
VGCAVASIWTRRHGASRWHPEDMTKEIDRVRGRAAVSVLRQHPGMALFVASPGIVALCAVWWLFGAGWAALLLVALVLAGGAAVVLKRN